MTSGSGTGTAIESIAPSLDCKTACNVVPAIAAGGGDSLDDASRFITLSYGGARSVSFTKRTRRD
jgi:hypothetical protein